MNAPLALTNQETRLSAPLCAPKLSALLEDTSSDRFDVLQVVDADTAAELEALIERLQALLAPTPDVEIDRMMGKLALLYPASKLGDREEDERLGLYRDMLRDIPRAQLAEAFANAAKTCKFFPTVAEIRDRVKSHPISAQIWGARRLLLKHRMSAKRAVPLDPLPSVSQCDTSPASAPA